MKRSIAILSLLTLFAGAACTKEKAVAPAPVKTAPQGEKVIFWGPNTQCEGSMIFELPDGSFITSKDYPPQVLNLKPGDVVYIEYTVLKTKEGDAILATPPVKITSISPPVKPDTQTGKTGGGNH